MTPVDAFNRVDVGPGQMTNVGDATPLLITCGHQFLLVGLVTWEQPEESGEFHNPVSWLKAKTTG